MAVPRVLLDVPGAQVEQALATLRDPDAVARGEVLEVTPTDGRVEVALSHHHERRTAVLRRLNSLRRADVTVLGFAWRDPETSPDDAWLEDAFDRWEEGRRHDSDGLPPIEVARRRFGRLVGDDVVERLVAWLGSRRLDPRRRRTIAHAAGLAAFNTHSTTSAQALVAAGVALADLDGPTSMRLLDGAREVAELNRFGIRTAIEDKELATLLDHPDWQVHGAATMLVAALPTTPSVAVTDELVRLAHGLAPGPRSTQTRAEQVVRALARAAAGRSDVDVALEALRGHASSAVRADATWALANRTPELARSMWEPWLRSRSPIERTTAESMIATWGEERDVREVARIVEHRLTPSSGMTHWPPLASDGLAFLVRHDELPEAAAVLDRVREGFSELDDDVRRWLRRNQPELVADHASDGPDDADGVSGSR